MLCEYAEKTFRFHPGLPDRYFSPENGWNPDFNRAGKIVPSGGGGRVLRAVPLLVNLDQGFQEVFSFGISKFYQPTL